MAGRFQFSVKSALLATFWIAVWFAIIATEGFFMGSDSPLALPGRYFWFFLLIAAPAAALGAIFRHPVLGFFCGIASAIAYAIWETYLEG